MRLHLRRVRSPWLLALAVVAAVLLIILLRHPMGGGTGFRAIPPSAEPAQPSAQSTPGIAPAAGTMPNPPQLGAAQQVAGLFAVAYVGYRYDDTTATVQDRVRPFSTAAFVDRLGDSSSAAQLGADRRQRHEVATARVEDLGCAAFDDDSRIPCTAQLTVTTTWDDGGGAITTHFLEMFLAPADRGWRVDEVQE